MSQLLSLPFEANKGKLKNLFSQKHEPKAHYISPLIITSKYYFVEVFLLHNIKRRVTNYSERSASDSHVNGLLSYINTNNLITSHCSDNEHPLQRCNLKVLESLFQLQLSVGKLFL